MGSIFQNVSYGLVGTEWENASEEEQMKLVEEACKAAYAHDFVQTLPEVRFFQPRCNMISNWCRDIKRKLVRGLADCLVGRNSALPLLVV